jgi:NTP pyrophosphatase (non-canonical NTP hydrolase)
LSNKGAPGRWTWGTEFTLGAPDYTTYDYHPDMNLNQYQTEALKTAVYPNMGSNFPYPALGLAGESGEVADKLKKVIRDNDGVLTDPVRDAVAKELGDVLWYVSVLAYELDYDLETIAANNLAKLASRQERGVLTGSGDNR